MALLLTKRKKISSTASIDIQPIRLRIIFVKFFKTRLTKLRAIASQ